MDTKANIAEESLLRVQISPVLLSRSDAHQSDVNPRFRRGAGSVRRLEETISSRFLLGAQRVCCGESSRPFLALISLSHLIPERGETLDLANVLTLESDSGKSIERLGRAVGTVALTTGYSWVLKSPFSEFAGRGVARLVEVENLSMQLILGGASLGNSYGLFAAKDSKDEVTRSLETIRAAGKLGFTAIDTAPVYGSSELVIGRSRWEGEVHTKLHLEENPYASIENSLSRLGRENVDVLYLFHDPREFYSRPESLLEGLADSLRPFAKKIGVSLYSPADVAFFLTKSWVDVIQVPVNLLNRACLKELSQHKARGATIIARSVFLQGLLAQETPHLPHTGLSPFLQTINRFAATTGRTTMGIALGWVMAQDLVDGVILGAQSAVQLAEIMSEFSDSVLSPDDLEFLNSLPLPPDSLTDPRNWK